jgi:hypothetical protein
MEQMPKAWTPVFWLHGCYRAVGKDGFEGFVFFATTAAHF